MTIIFPSSGQSGERLYFDLATLARQLGVSVDSISIK
jgi:hypothetical protein